MSNNTALQKSKWIEPQHKLSTKNEYGRLKQICRVDSLDSFVEVLNDSFHSDKITFNFQKYDKNNAIQFLIFNYFLQKTLRFHAKPTKNRSAALAINAAKYAKTMHRTMRKREFLRPRYCL